MKINMILSTLLPLLAISGAVADSDSSWFDEKVAAFLASSSASNSTDSNSNTKSMKSILTGNARGRQRERRTKSHKKSKSSKLEPMLTQVCEEGMFYIKECKLYSILPKQWAIVSFVNKKRSHEYFLPV